MIEIRIKSKTDVNYTSFRDAVSTYLATEPKNAKSLKELEKLKEKREHIVECIDFGWCKDVEILKITFLNEDAAAITFCKPWFNIPTLTADLKENHYFSVRQQKKQLKKQQKKERKKKEDEVQSCGSPPLSQDVLPKDISDVFAKTKAAIEFFKTQFELDASTTSSFSEMEKEIVAEANRVKYQEMVSEIFKEPEPDHKKLNDELSHLCYKAKRLLWQYSSKRTCSCPF